MPTKHIDEKAWKIIEHEVVKAVIATKKGIKETQILNYALIKGLKNLNEEDYENIANKRVNVSK